MIAFLMSGNDFSLNNGKLSLTEDVRTLTEQRLKTALSFFKGEWRLDPRLGIPYFNDVLKKDVDFSRVRALMVETILQDPQIARIERLSLFYDKDTRALSLEFEAKLNNDEVLTVPAMPLLREFA